MKLTITLPFDRITPADEFTTMQAVTEIGRVIEQAGFHGAVLTDHPCPTGRWLDAGGHHAQGPFVMLALLAAVTNRIRLQTGILVLPYRNPFIVARDVATLDRFSGGRVTLSVGAGYLKGEYRALGVDFEQRNELTDEYMRALRVALTGEEFTFEGSGYKVFGSRILPGPVQKKVPLFVGGNSRRAIRRVVELGDGWNPFLTAGTDSAATRTAAMESLQDLQGGISYMREHCEKIGREDLPEIEITSVVSLGEDGSAQMLLDRIGQYRELGIGYGAVHIAGTCRAEFCENALRFGEDVIAKL
jgi:probable F420-dependent oxidoreductase